MFSDEIKDRFWSRVQMKGENECWEWNGCIGKNDIGVFSAFSATNRSIKAHKAAYIISHNKEVPEGMYVLQSCRNRICCNPKHLYLSDKRRNNGDLTIEERFLDKVDKSSGECWIWTAKKYYYGHFDIGGETLLAHRVSYSLFVGELEDGKVIAHKCDNPLCVRPEHLMMCTQQENIQDCIDKGRRAKEKPNQWGEKSHKAKLTDKDVLEIRRLYKEGKMLRRIAEQFGVNESTIKAIVNRRTWKHI